MISRSPKRIIIYKKCISVIIKAIIFKFYVLSIEIDEIVIDHIIENTNGFIYMQYYPLQSTQYVLRLPQTCE